jgi:hypothetical protein
MVGGGFGVGRQDVATVIAMNPNPMGVASINYGAFSYLGYLTFPYIYRQAYDATVWTEEEEINKIKDQLDSHLSKEGLSKRPNSKGKLSTRQLSISVIKGGVVISK